MRRESPLGAWTEHFVGILFDQPLNTYPLNPFRCYVACYNTTRELSALLCAGWSERRVPSPGKPWTPHPRLGLV
jgi:hypothetical protein